MTRDEWKACVGPGWGHLLDALFASWDSLARRYIVQAATMEDAIELTDVKEKFGSLRIYYDVRWRIPDWDHGTFQVAADVIEELSAHVCEECGSPGKIRRTGWHKCLCNECNNTQHTQKERK